MMPIMSLSFVRNVKNVKALEYNSVTWSPMLKKDIVCIEKVQRHFTKRLPGLKNLTYQGRLNHLNLITLELRRLHLDLIMCYKIIIGLVNVNCINFLQLSPSSHTRRHAYKLYKQRSLTNTGTAFLATESLMCGITYTRYSWFLHSKQVQILINTVSRSIGIFAIWLVSNTQYKVDFYPFVFSNTLYVVAFNLLLFFSFLFTGLLLVPYGLIYSARIVCIEHCLDVNHACITLCEDLNDDDDEWLKY